MRKPPKGMGGAGGSGPPVHSPGSISSSSSSSYNYNNNNNNKLNQLAGSPSHQRKERKTSRTKVIRKKSSLSPRQNGKAAGLSGAEEDDQPSLFVSSSALGEATAMDRAVLHNPTVAALIALLLRCCVGLHPHSGQLQPPLYGEFEAQRQLLEITVNTPLCEWYTTKNETISANAGAGLYPYPPLHAYVAWFFGGLAQNLVPKLVNNGHGYENEDARAFMRASVLFCDVLVFFTATWFFCIKFYRSNVQVQSSPTDGSTNSDDLKDTAARFFLYSTRAPVQQLKRQRKAPDDNSNKNNFGAGGRSARRRNRNIGSRFSSTMLSVPVALVSEIFLIILLQPAFVLVDHGHFQYSVVFLGLVLWTLVFCLQESLISAACTFSLAVNYNQLALYYLPPFLLFFLWSSGAKNAIRSRSGSSRRSSRSNSISSNGSNSSGNTTNGSIGTSSKSSRTRALVLALRVLSVAKVIAALLAVNAALWLPFCLSHGAGASFAGKRFEMEQCVDGVLQVLKSVRKTRMWPGLLGLGPCCYDLVRRGGRAPSVRRLVWACFNCSLTFFLFSYGSEPLAILLPLLPATLLAGEVPGPSCWFSFTAIYSLVPLLYEDRLAIPAVVSTSIFLATSAICFRGELCFLPLPWVDNSSSSKDVVGIRHGIRMVDSTQPLKLALLWVTTIALLSILLPGLTELWTSLHLLSVNFVLFVAWLYGNWYQWMLAPEVGLLDNTIVKLMSRSPSGSPESKKKEL